MSAYISVLGTSRDSISVQLAGCDTSYSKGDRSLYWYLNGSLKHTTSLGAYVYSGGDYTFYGLTPDTGYNILAIVTNGNWTSEFSAYIWTDRRSVIRPSDWNWTSSEIHAFNNNGSIKALSQSRWNSFIDRINAYVDYVNDLDRRSISHIPSSCYMGSDKLMYATSFNQVVEKIKEITGHSLSGITLPRKRGEPLKGAYFPYMSNILNSI